MIASAMSENHADAAPAGADAAPAGADAAPAGADAAAADQPGGEFPGAAIMRWSWITTAVFVAATAIAVVWAGFEPVTVAVDLGLFALGVLVFLAAFLAGAARSRTHEVNIGGWFFLLGDTAPRSVKRHLLGAFAVQVVVAFATAGIRYPSALAFGTLVPLLGLAWCGRWGGRYGKFPDRVLEPRLRRNIEQNADHG